VPTTRATIVLRKIDATGRPVRQIVLFDRHAEAVIARECKRIRDSRSSRWALISSANGVVEDAEMTKPRHAAVPSQIMTVAEVAKYLQAHPSTLYRLLRQHQIPAFKIGSDYRFERDAIVKWMADGQVKV
jgi:excisionase family DNA binding protein